VNQRGGLSSLLLRFLRGGAAACALLTAAVLLIEIGRGFAASESPVARGEYGFAVLLLVLIVGLCALVWAITRELGRN
jgi:hypothetical protein